MGVTNSTKHWHIIPFFPEGDMKFPGHIPVSRLRGKQDRKVMRTDATNTSCVVTLFMM